MADQQIALKTPPLGFGRLHSLLYAYILLNGWAVDKAEVSGQLCYFRDKSNTTVVVHVHDILLELADIGADVVIGQLAD